MLPYPSRKKKSKKLFIVSTVIAACLFSGSYLIFSNFSNDEVVAKINGQKIYKSEIELRLHDVFESQGSNTKTPDLNKLPKEIIEILAKEIYLERELTKEALKSDAVKTKEVKDKINDTKNKILRQAYIDSILKNEITETRINDKYLELSKELEGKKEYQIFHIVVKNKEEAEKIAQELKSRKGVKFADLAKKYSIDQESASKGGELDYTLEDSMLKEIAAVVTTLEKDQISDPIETKYGWHLVKIGDIREAKALSFEAVKDNIRDQLIQDRVNEINNRIINNAKVQVLIQLKEIEKSEEKKPEETGVVATETAAPAEVKDEAQANNEKAVEEKADENKDQSNAKQKKHKKSKR